MSTHTLKSGQINFENNDNPGAFSCIVIKNGRFYNMKPEHKQMIIDAMNAPEEPTPTLEDMF